MNDSRASNSRAAILARLSVAQKTAYLPPRRPELPSSVDFPRRSPDECLEKFLQECKLLGIETHVAASAEDVRRRVTSLTANRRILCWDAENLPYDLGSLLSGCVRGSDPREKQAAAEIGVTGCDAAIAETGTLAIISGPGKYHAASLLPPVHLAVVQRGDFCFTMSEFFVLHAEQFAAASYCAFITGPSRTADIELTLTVGVHGPGRIIVVIGP